MYNLWSVSVFTGSRYQTEIQVRYSHGSHDVLYFVKSKRMPFIFNDESTGSCICLRLDLHMSHVKKRTRRKLQWFISTVITVT
jgi:hypothetical protein